MNPMKNVLVTGGAGYVGSHGCKALAIAGYYPVVFDSLENGHRDMVKWGPLIEGDLRDAGAIERAVKDVQPTAVLHFAAYAYVGESMNEPGKYYRNNLVGTLNLLDAMRCCGIDKLVFSSTCSTFGVPIAPTIDESHPQRPINPYGKSKLAIESMLQDYDLAYGLRSISLRYFNAAGADEGGEIGEAHEPETHLVPLILQTALGERERIDVFGNDFDTSDGTCVRDYVHVSDLADAHVLALKQLEAGGATTAYNLGTGRGYSVRELIAVCSYITGRNIASRDVDRRTGDPAVLIADPSLARSKLGWRPRYDDIESIVRTAWAWHSKAAVSA
jgi:UDP-arabinose 4-epimerase